MKPQTRYDRELDVVQAELREARRRALVHERALARMEARLTALVARLDALILGAHRQTEASRWRIGTGLPILTWIVGIIVGFLLRQP